jgi:hypothetical protein
MFTDLASAGMILHSEILDQVPAGMPPTPAAFCYRAGRRLDIR